MTGVLLPQITMKGEDGVAIFISSGVSTREGWVRPTPREGTDHLAGAGLVPDAPSPGTRPSCGLTVQDGPERCRDRARGRCHQIGGNPDHVRGGAVRHQSPREGDEGGGLECSAQSSRLSAVCIDVTGTPPGTPRLRRQEERAPFSGMPSWMLSIRTSAPRLRSCFPVLGNRAVGQARNRSPLGDPFHDAPERDLPPFRAAKIAFRGAALGPNSEV